MVDLWPFTQTHGLLAHSLPPFHFVGLACHDPVQWVVAFLFWFTICQHQWVYMSSLGLTYMFLQRSAAKSLYLWSSPIFSGFSGRGPQFKPQLPIFLPQGSFTGNLLGDHLAMFLLWCPLFITSWGGSLAWGGTGTPVPFMTVAHTQGNANLWHNKKKPVSVEDLWPSMLVGHFVGGHISHNLSWHLPGLFIPPMLNLLLSLPGIHLH